MAGNSTDVSFKISKRRLQNVVLLQQGVNAHSPIITMYFLRKKQFLTVFIKYFAFIRKYHFGSRFVTVFSFSFQSDFSLGDKTTLVKSVSATDARLLAALPKGVNWFQTHTIIQNKT